MARAISAEEARERIEPGWARLNELLQHIPEDRAEEPGVNGDWSVNVVLGHIAYWERNAKKIIQLMAAGEQLPPIDFNAINKELAAGDKDRPYAELRREFDEAHHDLLDIIDKTGTVDGERLSWDTWDHYPEHIKQLEQWRAKIGI